MRRLQLKLLGYLVSKFLPFTPTGMTRDEELEILYNIHQVKGSDKLFQALISSNIAGYFNVPEGEEEMRLLKKGTVMGYRWFRKEMAEAKRNLELIRGRKEKQDALSKEQD